MNKDIKSNIELVKEEILNNKIKRGLILKDLESLISDIKSACNEINIETNFCEIISEETFEQCMQEIKRLEELLKERYTKLEKEFNEIAEQVKQNS